MHFFKELTTIPPRILPINNNNNHILRSVTHTRYSHTIYLATTCFLIFKKYAHYTEKTLIFEKILQICFAIMGNCRQLYAAKLTSAPSRTARLVKGLSYFLTTLKSDF